MPKSAHRALGPLVVENASGKELTILAVLRNAARECSSPMYRFTLAAAADQIEAALKAVTENPTTSCMQALVGAWAHGVAVYEGRPDEAPDNPPLAGAPEPARLAA